MGASIIGHTFCIFFAVAGPMMWNSLPKCVRSTETLTAFGKQLKTYKFCLHYMPWWHWFLCCSIAAF